MTTPLYYYQDLSILKDILAEIQTMNSHLYDLQSLIALTDAIKTYVQDLDSCVNDNQISVVLPE